jgi:hypothetical protein
MLKDKNGHMVALSILTEDYYNMRSENYQTANERFLETYGENGLFAMIPRSTSDVYGVVRTQEGADFLANHPNLVTQLPLTHNLFAPQDGEFDYPTYLKSFLSGERDPVSTDTWIRWGNKIRGDMWYRRAIEERGGDFGSMTDEEQAELRQIKQTIRETFPGFDEGVPGLPGKPGVDAMISEIEVALRDPKTSREIRNTEVGKGLVEYMGYRQQAIDKVNEEHDAGITTATSPWRANAYRDMRNWLRDRSLAIQEKYPDFRAIYSTVFEREMAIDDEE